MSVPRKDASYKLLPQTNTATKTWKGCELANHSPQRTGHALHLTPTVNMTKRKKCQGPRKMKRAEISSSHCLQAKRASFVPAESALAQDQQARTKAILFTRSAML